MAETAQYPGVVAEAAFSAEMRAAQARRANVRQRSISTLADEDPEVLVPTPTQAELDVLVLHAHGEEVPEEPPPEVP